jgi:hypothetical protein
LSVACIRHAIGKKRKGELIYGISKTDHSPAIGEINLCKLGIDRGKYLE